MMPPAMSSTPQQLLLLVLPLLLLLQYIHNTSVLADTNKYRVCVVDGHGGHKKSGIFCPILDQPESKVECVIGQDRLDCLRRIAKGKVDFAVFTAEDLIAATNAQIEILITNEFRFSKQRFDYDVVAVVNDDSGINSKYELNGKRFCHPGYGYEDDWTRILANYFESSVVPRSCETRLSLKENRIKASSEYFQAACKAGPWVNDEILDAKLKRKYRNLCELCGNPIRCSMHDKYWGRRGPLYCLTDGVGDVAWARLDDTRSHFGLIRGAQAASPTGYSYLCSDGTKRPLNGTALPCVWVSKPWPVVGAKRTSAQEIQRFLNRLDHNDTSSWQHALLNLLENYHIDITSVSPVQAIESYLAEMPGFRSANSFASCNPPRSIRLCTTSNLENAKCNWLRDAAVAYGIEPDVECIKANNKTHCMEAVQLGLADVIPLPTDLVSTAQNQYQLQTLLYEDVAEDRRYHPIIVSKKKIKTKDTRLLDLRGKRACFPSYGGVAYQSFVHQYRNEAAAAAAAAACPWSARLAEYLGASCIPDAPPQYQSFRQLCTGNSSIIYRGDMGALKCLATFEDADIAVVSKLAAIEYMKRNNNILNMSDELIGGGWATVGRLMVHRNVSVTFFHEISDTFIKLDQLFGKNYQSVTPAFSLYGSFDGRHDVLFHDDTLQLSTSSVGDHYVRSKKIINTRVPSYDQILADLSVCTSSSSSSSTYHLLSYSYFIVYMIDICILFN